MVAKLNSTQNNRGKYQTSQLQIYAWVIVSSFRMIQDSTQSRKHITMQNWQSRLAALHALKIEINKYWLWILKTTIFSYRLSREKNCLEKEFFICIISKTTKFFIHISRKQQNSSYTLSQTQQNYSYTLSRKQQNYSYKLSWKMFALYC